MKAMLLLFVFLNLVSSCSTGSSMLRSADELAVTIIHTNDFHGHITPFKVSPGNATAQTGDPGGPMYEFEREGMVGGLAHLATYIKGVKRDLGEENVLVVHAGDTFSDSMIGNLTEGEAMIEILNQIGFDFSCFGNHDFDYSYQRTRRLQEIAQFPLRGANVLEKETGRPALGEPTAVFSAGGIGIGFLALGYHNTHQTTNPKNVKELEFIPGHEVAQPYVDDLRQRSDIVVVVSHQGTEVDQLLARQVKGIDIIIGGHSHDRISKIDDTFIVQALSDSAVVGRLDLYVKNNALVNIESTTVTLWNDQYYADTQVADEIRKQREPFKKQLEEVICQATERIGRQYMSESPFDTMVAEILVNYTGADVGMLPGVGFGVSLNPGPVTREQLIQLIPHSSKVAEVVLTGSQIIEILEQSAENIKPDDPIDTVGGLVQTARMSWTVDLTRPIGSRVSNIAVDGSKIEMSKNYKVATHSGMLKGVHRYSTFSKGKETFQFPIKVNELVEREFNRKKNLFPPHLGNVKLIK